MEGAEEELQELCWTRARSMYGEKLPEIVVSGLSSDDKSLLGRECHARLLQILLSIEIWRYDKEEMGSHRWFPTSEIFVHIFRQTVFVDIHLGSLEIGDICNFLHITSRDHLLLHCKPLGLHRVCRSIHSEDKAQSQYHKKVDPHKVESGLFRLRSSIVIVVLGLVTVFSRHTRLCSLYG